LVEYTYSGGMLTKAVDTKENVITTYQYDIYGNITKVATTSQTDNGSSLSVTDYTYDVMANMLTAQSDSSSSSYDYDAAGRQIQATEDGAVTRTLYDAYGRVIQQIEPDIYDAAKDGLPQTNTYADSTAGHTYEYAQNGNLVSETSKYGVETQYSYNSVGKLIQKHFDIYDYHYLADGSIDKICVDGQTVVDYSYKAANSGITLSDGNYVDQIIYANGDVESYKYNSEGTLTAVFKNGEEKPEKYWELSADLSTKLPETRNWETGMRYRYDEENSQVSIYDNLVYLSNSEPAGFYQSTQTDADETSDTPATSTISGNIYSTDLSVFTDGSKIVNTVGELSNTYSFTANEDGVLVSDGITVGENTVLPAEYSYDDSGRNTEKSVTLANNTEPVSLLQQYDVNGMITGSGIDEITAHYTYDDSDQLIRTNDSFANYTSSYEYDSRGNMLSKKLYDYTTGDLGTAVPTETTTFTYANSGWKDQLTAVNGTALTYDENGNLLTYGDKTFSWCHGTRLESITDSENTYSYVYDENGTRFSKTVNGTTTQFNYVGGLLLSQKTGEEIIFFQYGAGGVPLGFVYNGVQYFYVTNQLGDVLGITDATGKAIVEYTYDEWGNPIQTITRDNTEEQNKIAQLNPLRYRGYYYDAETGYYYLQSRYYNPKWGRFISPDSFDYIDNTTQLGCNAYIYCINSPLIYVDPLGFSKEYSLSKGWKYRIDPQNSSKGEQRHIHVWKNGDEYSQNDDGSPHKGGGSPPNSVKEELKEKAGWDWDAKEKSYRDNQLKFNFDFDFSLDFTQVGDIVVFALVVGFVIFAIWFVLPFLLTFAIA